MKIAKQLFRDVQGSATIEHALVLAFVATGFVLAASIFSQQVLAPLVASLDSVLVLR